MQHLGRALERLSIQLGQRWSRGKDSAHRANVVSSVNVGTPNSSRVVTATQRTELRQVGGHTTAEERNG